MSSAAMFCHAAAFLALITSVAAVTPTAAAPTANASAAPDAADKWTMGRATFYGRGDGFSVHKGSCEYGHLDPKMGVGLNIAALSDQDPDFEGSCGTCYEVACVPGMLTDGLGEVLDRFDACRNGSVTVMITDSCPCVKPENQESNKRWCCGDQRHFDLSWKAFEKIGNPDKGVVPIKFRKVPCPTGPYSSALTPRPALSALPWAVAAVGAVGGLLMGA